MLTLRLRAALAGLLLMAAPAFAQNNISIDKISSSDKAAYGVFTLSRLEVANTNLSRDEIQKLFSSDTSRQDVAALAARMTADKLSIAGASFVKDDTTMTFGPFEATAIANGRFATATLAGFEGTFPDKQRNGALTGRAMRLKGGDISPLLKAMQSGGAEAAAFNVGSFAWDGFDGAFTDPETPAGASGGNQIKVGLQGLTAVTDFKGATPVSSKIDAVGFVLDPPPASEFGKGIRAFGYDRVELGMSGEGQYDPATQTLLLQNYTLTSPQAGRLSLSGELSGVDAAALTSTDPSQRGMALLGASVQSLKIGFVNEGLVEKSFAFAGAKQGKSPAALRSEVSSMAVQLLPLLLGGDPQSLALAQSVQAFLSAPRNFTLTLKARGAPVPLARLGAIRDPKTFLALVDVNLAANQ